METNTDELEKYQKLLIETNEALQDDPDDEVLIETRDKIQDTIKRLQSELKNYEKTNEALRDAPPEDEVLIETVDKSSKVLQAGEDDDSVKEPTVRGKQEEEGVKDSRSARSRQKRRLVRDDEEDRTYDKATDSEVPKRKSKKSRARADEPKPSKSSAEPSRSKHFTICPLLT